MWYPDVMDIEGDELISDQELMDGLSELDGELEGLIGKLTLFVMRFTDRVMTEGEHDCPLDHSVLEAMEQSKIRAAEAMMWLKTAVQTKVTGEGLVDLSSRPSHDPENAH